MNQSIQLLYLAFGYTIGTIMARHGQNVMQFVAIAITLGVLIGFLSSIKKPSKDPRWSIPALRIMFGCLKGGYLATALALLASFGELEIIGLSAALGALFAFLQPAIRYEAVAGLNPVIGCKSSEQLSVASAMLARATFKSARFEGTRVAQHFLFGGAGPSTSYMQLLQQDLDNAQNLTFGILAILVKQLPDKPGEPALLVIQDAELLRLTRADADGISGPVYTYKIKIGDIIATTSYAWFQEKVSA